MTLIGAGPFKVRLIQIKISAERISQLGRSDLKIQCAIANYASVISNPSGSLGDVDLPKHFQVLMGGSLCERNGTISKPMKEPPFDK